MRSRLHIIISVLLFIIAVLTFIKTALLALLIAAAGATILAKGFKHASLRVFEKEQVLRMLFLTTLGFDSLLVAGYAFEREGALYPETALLFSGGVILLATAVIEAARFSREHKRSSE